MPVALLMIALLLPTALLADEPVCTALPPLPGSELGEEDLAQEAASCAIDFRGPASAGN